MRRCLRSVALASLALGLLALEARAQTAFDDVRRDSKAGLAGNIGYSFVTGEIGDSISGGLAVEIAGVAQLPGAPLRLGGGGGYSRWDFEEGRGSADKWSLYALATYLVFSDDTEMIPYVQGRLGWSHLRDDRGTGGSSRSRSGLEVGAAVGVDIPLTERWSLDVLGLFKWFSPGDVEESGVGVPNTSQSGSSVGIRAGAVFWLP